MTKYPLTWPAGWKRSQSRANANFSKGERQYSTDPANRSSWLKRRDLTVNDATQRVLKALRIFGVLEGDAIISTNVELRLDGLPRSNQPEPADPGAAVYWQRVGDKGGFKCMAIDRYDRVADNIAAIAATLDAMRAIERHGGALILDRAFMGFTALPAPGQTAGKGWREILGFGPDITPARREVEVSYKVMRSKYHPDKPGGSAEMFDTVQRAWELAQQEIRA